jgi:hypothetical protein
MPGAALWGRFGGGASAGLCWRSFISGSRPESCLALRFWKALFLSSSSWRAGVLRDVSTLCAVNTSCWTIWGGGHRFVGGYQYTVCCSTSCWTIWGGGHRCVGGCQCTVCCGTSCWTIWGGGTGVLELGTSRIK